MLFTTSTISDEALSLLLLYVFAPNRETSTSRLLISENCDTLMKTNVGEVKRCATFLASKSEYTMLLYRYGTIVPFARKLNVYSLGIS